MSRLNFDVIDTGNLVVRAHVSGPQGEAPMILQSMKTLLVTKGKRGLACLTKDFPKDSRVIDLLYIVLCCCKIKEVSGVHWSTMNGHSIHITTEPT